MDTYDKLNPIFETALNKNEAFFVDWQSSVEDIVFNIKTILPQLDINSLPTKQVYGDWMEYMIFEDKQYDFKQDDSPAKIVDIVHLVNISLEKINKYLIFFDTEDDNYNFILIKYSELPDYVTKGFKKV